MGISRGLGERELRSWQILALESWLAAGSRGIVAAATGTGKTMVAMAAIDALDSDDLRVFIVVPKLVLVEQWTRSLRNVLGIQGSQVGIMSGQATPPSSSNHAVIAVINSARTKLKPLVERWRQQGRKVLLIVDECHWSGSEENSQIFSVPMDATLGLSATPERSDDGFEDNIVPGLGNVVYRYTLRQALDDQVLAPLRLINLYVDLESEEWSEYSELSDQISKLISVLESAYPQLRYAGERWPGVLHALAKTDKRAEQLELRIHRRRRLVSNAHQRRACLQDLLDSRILFLRKVIFFHETIESAEWTLGSLADGGYEAVIDHSELDRATREAAHGAFRSSGSKILVAVKTADEGIDIPDADMEVIVSGTLTSRQRIQRIGRILRPSGGEALCISILAKGTSEETRVGARDGELVGEERVSHHLWPRTSVSAALDRAPGSHAPREEPSNSTGDRAAASDYRYVGIRRASMADDSRYARCTRCNMFSERERDSCRHCGASLVKPQP